ncbi:DUF4129 domain-containing protein [Vulcanisaeta sp. JCM 16159]|uniref:DUF4129 domain-containing protein n=1 Tax=Vulcanisaeta sp. JCM 16159 TaxID=1295371 RepID=UPI0006D18C81|nr:DUF4129 domain-containing protein [Vulcanisaeta sp. JCM 16159]
MNKSAILILAIGLLITWLLTSSIGILIKLNELRGSQGSSSLNIHVSLPQPAITLPPINLTIPQRVNETSNAELYVPLIPLPVIMPNVSINITKYLAVSTPKPSQALSGGSPGTLGSQEGLGSSQQYVSNTVVPLKIPPLLMMIAIIFAIAIIGISSLAIIRREIRKSDQPGSTANVSARISPRINVGPKSGDEEFPKFSRNIELLPGEAVKKINGWGGNDIIDLGIPRDLPLIWRFNDPLPMIVRGDAQVMVTRPGIISNGSLIMPSRGCYGISIRLGDREEDLFVRAGDYGDDIVNFVRLNIGGLTVRDSETIREVMKRLVNDGVINGDWESINTIIRLFERVRYGLRDVDRNDYEKFLRALGRVFRDARVIICEGAS